MDINCLKLGLHCLICSTFTPYFMCWNYFDECCMDKSLLHTSLTKFNKLNKTRKRTFLITQFKNEKNIAWFLISKISFYMYTALALYLTFIFHTFSVYLWRIVWSTPVPVQFFWPVVKIICCELYVLLYDYVYF